MIRKRLTYANAMSTIAVFLLLGGGAAIAAKQKPKRIGTNQIKAQAITTGKLKDGAVTSSKLAPGSVDGSKLADGSVSTQKIQGGAVTGEKIAGDSVTGAQVNESSLSEVPTAGSANPYVFARVAANGAVDGGSSKGLTAVNVNKPPLEFGVYCITLPAFSPRGGQVTPERSSGNPVTATLALGGGPSCAPPRVEVETFVGGSLADVGFYVSFYR